MGLVTGILFLVLVITISVGIHEFGHMIPAKFFGATVSEYSIGFGPKLGSFYWRGTKYCLRVIPIGGFVRIVGMFWPGKPGRKITNSAGQLTVAEQSRQESQAEVEKYGAKPFWQLKVWQRIIVMFGGPFTNLVLAFFCIWIACGVLGTYNATTQVSKVAQCLPVTVSGAKTEGCENGVRSPAAESGIQVADEIVAVNEKSVTYVSELTQALQNTVGKVILTVQRQGKILNLPVEPLHMTRNGEKTVLLGVQGTLQRETVGIGETVSRFGQIIQGTGKVLLTIPMRLYDLTYDLITGQPRDPNGVVGLVGVGQIAAKVSTAQVDGYDLKARIADLLMLVAGLNLSLFMLNMFPILPLDGGHIAGQLWEGIRRGIAKLRKRPDPGPVDVAAAWPISYGVFTVITLMGILLIVADIMMPVVR